MKNTKIRFQRMGLEEIRSQPPGKWSGSDLLDVLDDLRQAERAEETWAKEIAIRSLILHSPDHSEIIDYNAVYFDQTLVLESTEKFDASIATAYAALVYHLQHDERSNAYTWLRQIAGTFLAAGEMSVGIAQFARIVRGEPGNLSNYYTLITALDQTGLPVLAREALAAADVLMEQQPDDSNAPHIERLRESLSESNGEDNPDNLSAIDPQALADLRTAFALTRAGRQNTDEYLPPLAVLLDEDPNRAIDHDDEILAQGQVLVPELLFLAWDEELYGTPAPEHALRLLRSLRDRRPALFVDIDRWLQQAKGDWRDLLSTRFGLVGGYSQSELREWVANAGCDWMLRSATGDALVQRANDHPQERAEIVAFLSDLLSRPEAEANVDEETVTACLIGNLADLGAVETYPAIEAAFAEDRVDVQMLDLDFVQEKLGLPRTTPPRRKDGLYLNLTCKRCGRTRPHFVQHVTIDIGSQERRAEGRPIRYDPHVMDREIICPKCGARDAYELRPMDALHLIAETQGLGSWLRMATGDADSSPVRPSPYVTRIKSVIFDRPMHPLEGLAEYRRRIRRNPQNADLRVRMSMLLRVIHRFPESLETIRQAYEVRPTDPEVMVFRALAEHDFGDKDAAQELYESALSRLLRSARRLPQASELVGIAEDGLHALAAGRPSPWQPQYLSAEEEAALAGRDRRR